MASRAIPSNSRITAAPQGFRGSTRGSPQTLALQVLKRSTVTEFRRVKMPSGVAGRNTKLDVVSFGFLKKLGLKKPDFLPDFGKPAGAGDSKDVFEKQYNCSAADMWEKLSDWSAPFLEGAEVVTAGTGVGATRNIKMEAGEFKEELTSYDDAKMKLTYKIIGPNPFPMENYGAKIKVDEVDENKCTVTYTGYFDLIGDATVDSFGLSKLYEKWVDIAFASL